MGNREQDIVWCVEGALLSFGFLSQCDTPRLERKEASTLLNVEAIKGQECDVVGKQMLGSVLQRGAFFRYLTYENNDNDCKASIVVKEGLKLL